MKLVKTLSKILVVVVLSSVVLALKSGGASAATFNVVTGPGCNLPEAMENIANQTQTNVECPASTGNDVINLPAGTITLGESLPVLDTPVSVIGQGRGVSIIDGGGNTKLFHQMLGGVNSTVGVEFRDFTARNISRALNSVCISVGSSTSSTGMQTMNVSNLDLENCGQISIAGGMFHGTTSVSGVNLSSDLPAESLGVYSYSQDSFNITNSSITGFTVGMELLSSGLMTSGTYSVTNSTITGNNLGLLFFVGSAIQDLAVTAQLYNNTIVNNSNNASSGLLASLSAGGVVFGAGNDDTISVDMKNNILAGNTRNSSLANCYAGTSQYYGLTTVTSTNNLSDDTCAGKLGSGNFTAVSGVASGIDVLSNNGGVAKTMALLIGSAAIDQGATVGTVTTDARGVARPQNSVYDIGAYEKTAQSTPDPDPVPEDPENPGPPDSTPDDPGTPGVPRTGKLIGALLASISAVALLVLVSKEIIDGRIKLSKSTK